MCRWWRDANGTLPQQNAAGAQQNPQAPMQATYSQAPNPAKQQDAYLCQDALGMEKLVSGEYETAIFSSAPRRPARR